MTGSVRSSVLVVAQLVAVLVLVVAQSASAVPATPAGGGGSQVDAIVVLHDDVDARSAALEMANANGGELHFVYEHALRGFAGTFPEGRLDAMRRDRRVDYVELDDPVQLYAQSTPTGIQRMFADHNTAIDIDQTDDVRVDVDVAIIDTGIDAGHPDLDVVDSVDCLYQVDGKGPSWKRPYTCGDGGHDDHYHGTHVAGTVAALDNGVGVVGVAPGARLWAVKVLSASGGGSEGSVIAGIDYVTAHADQIEVANMSLGGSGFSQAEYDAIQGAVNAGVAFAVAAGNSDADASGYSPAAFDNVLTVSALADFDGAPGGDGPETCRADTDDTLADFSNWGTAVDIAAPGVCIDSTFPTDQDSYATLSGTSMASPHVAGALALLASASNPVDATDVGQLYGAVLDAGNFVWTDDSGDGRTEPLLDVSDTDLFVPRFVAGSGDEDVSDTPPTITITSPADGSTISGTVQVSGTVSDDGSTPPQVEVVAGGQTMAASVATEGDWTVSWDTTSSADGERQITATALDASGQSDTTTVTVTVGNPDAPADPVELTVTAYKVKGRQHADLAWSGIGTTDVHVYRDGVLITSTANDGRYTDATSTTGGGTRSYKVCETGSTTRCSPVVTVSY